MKEPVAENRFTLTRPLFTEGMLTVWRRGSGRSVGILLAVLGLAWLALTAVALLRGGSLAFPLTELVVLSLVSLWALVWLPRGKARRAYAALQARGAAEGERVLLFYDDRLTLSVAGTEKTLPYAEVAYILHSRHLLILVAEDNAGILIRNDSYTLGSEETVLRLIRQTKNETVHHA